MGFFSRSRWTLVCGLVVGLVGCETVEAKVDHDVAVIPFSVMRL